MTLREHFLHKDTITIRDIHNQKIVKSRKVDVESFQKSAYYDPSSAINISRQMTANANEMPSHHSPEALSDLPQTTDDSRSLLEQRYQITIERAGQERIKFALLDVYTDAIYACSAKKNTEGDPERSRYFDGIKEALNSAKKELLKQNSECLYVLCEKYKSLSLQFEQMIKDEAFDNSEEHCYSASYHLGLASGYLNLSEMVKDKLARAENERYRVQINPNQINS
jgi:hypothetical protein